MSVRGRPARYGTLTLLLAALLALAACSSGSSGSSGSSASANSPIAIGYEVPLTGTAAVAPFLGTQHIPLDNLALCGQTQLTFDARYGNALSSGWMCDQPDSVAADYMYTDLGYRHVTVLANDYAFGWLSAGAFMKRFTMLGGKIDKVLWPPLTTADFGPYVSAIPKNTQAVFAETVGAGSVTFTKAYAQFGLRGKIPLYG